MNSLTAELNKLKEENLYRSLRVVEGAPERIIRIDGKEYLNFSSNNYLGLASHPAVKKAACEAIEQFGTSSSASRLISGTMSIHHELEKTLASFKHTEAALVFPTGYQANTGIINTLVGKDDVICIDRLCHASLIDAARLSGAKLLVYPHRDVERLERILNKYSSYGKKLVVTDGVFSMDGDIAPLKEITRLSEQYDAYLLVDDAHGTGVLGKQGRGCLEMMNIENERIINMGTLSKALGSQGGFIAGSNELIQMLINKARSFIFTTGLVPSACGAALKSVELVKTEPWRRKNLVHKSQRLRSQLRSLGFNTLNSQTQIIPILIGEVEDTLRVAARLLEYGIFCPAIRPPTVPRGQARLRISLMSEHTDDDLNHLISLLKERI